MSEESVFLDEDARSTLPLLCLYSKYDGLVGDFKVETVMLWYTLLKCVILGNIKNDTGYQKEVDIAQAKEDDCLDLDGGKIVASDI